MDGLTASLLARACRIFLRHAYPGGDETVPPLKCAFLNLASHDALEPLLTPAVCQVLRHPGGRVRGYTLRLGCASYPHLKLQMVNCDDNSEWVFTVDTHDRIPLAADDPDAPRAGRVSRRPTASSRKVLNGTGKARVCSPSTRFCGEPRPGVTNPPTNSCCKTSHALLSISSKSPKGLVDPPPVGRLSSRVSPSRFLSGNMSCNAARRFLPSLSREFS